MKQLLLNSDNSWTGLILRLTIGGIMLPHGAQKMFGLFGGNGFRSTMEYFIRQMNLPWLISMSVILIQFFGSIGLIAGFASRIIAMLFIVIMIGAIITTNYQNGLFMNWMGNQKGEGFEYHLLVIGMCIALIVTGSGKFSTDGLFAP